MKTHRCEESIKQEVSIRYSKQFELLNIANDYECWRLFKHTHNWDYNSHHLNHVAEISNCPFCGMELR